MNSIQWRKSYETGVPQMDKEHKKLIDIINRLFLIQRDKTSYDELAEIYSQLVEYTEKHFLHEEDLLNDAQYAGLEEQITAHAAFVDKLKQLEQGLLAAQETVVPVINRFLREWWLNHIVEEDKKYGPLIQGVE